MRASSCLRPPARRPRAWAQSGFTLIELMVGIGIGLLVVVAAVGSLVFTQATSVVVGDSSQLQQKADMIFRNIGFHVTQAGAVLAAADPAGDPALVKFSSSFNGYNRLTTGFPTGVLAIHGAEGAGGIAPDTLRVSYEDNGTVVDCMGNRPLVGNAGVDNQFTVNAQGDLLCTAPTAPLPQSIADGVADFQVMYGVQTAGPSTRFFNANQMAGPGIFPSWEDVGAVQVCIELTGNNQANTQAPVVPAPTGCRNQALANDGLLHKVFRRTFVIRNAPQP